MPANQTHGCQISWRWLAGNSCFPNRRIFFFCFSEHMTIIIECTIAVFWKFCSEMPKANFAIWMTLYAKSILDTSNMNNWYHTLIFYAPFILSFDSKVAKIICFACFHSLLLWSIGTKISLKPLIVPSCA